MSDEVKGEEVFSDPKVLFDLIQMEMPFGKYAGRTLCDLPEPYLVWFKQKGFPKGRIGMLLASLYEIKLNGLEYLLKDLQKRQGFFKGNS